MTRDAATEALKVGDKVHYQPEYYGDRWENGIVKEVREGINDAVWVVYHAMDWHKYMDYTGAKTSLSDLKLGWL